MESFNRPAMQPFHGDGGSYLPVLYEPWYLDNNKTPGHKAYLAYFKIHATESEFGYQYGRLSDTTVSLNDNAWRRTFKLPSSKPSL